MDTADGALVQLRAYIAQGEFATGDRLPPERRLCETLHRTADRSRRAGSWREYETLDNLFHRTIAEATQNRPLLGMFDQLNAVRRTVIWGRLRRRADRPPADHHSFTEHEAILTAIEERDTDRSQALMREHLRSVGALLFPPA